MNPDVSSHIDDETFLQLACDELSREEVARIHEHFEACSECRRIWDAVRQVRDEARSFDPGVPPGLDATPPRVAKPLVGRWLALAAGLVMAAILLPRWLPEPSPPPPDGPIVRSSPQGSTSGATAELTLLSPLEGSRWTEPPRFSWSPLEDATGYSLEILGSEANILWSGPRSAELRQEWPETVPGDPGAYFCRVSAHFGDGVETVSSPLVAFSITGP